MNLMQGDLRAVSFSRLFPTRVARALCARLLLAVDLVHSRGFVHGDIRLGNVLTKALPQVAGLTTTQFRNMFGVPETVPVRRVDGRSLPLGVPSQAVLPLDLSKKAQEFTLDDAAGLVLCDYGEAFAPATEQRLGKDCNIPAAKKAPEAFFEPDRSLSYPSDVWSLGVALWEILGMKAIFSESEPENEIIAQQIEVPGLQSFPAKWLALWESPRTTSTAPVSGIPLRPRDNREAWPALEDAFEEFVQKYRRKQEDTFGVFGEEEAHMFLDLIRGILRFNPEERLTTQDVLKSAWMID